MTNSSEKIRIPAPILTIAHIIIAILLRMLIPLPLPTPPFVEWLGLGLTALGFILGILALLEFRRLRTSHNSKGTASGFVTSGIYQYTRNPIYLGFVLMLIGMPLSMGTYWGIFLTWPLVVFLNNLVIKPEEEALEKRFKSQYTDYKARVRRWL